ncbi:MAG: hypothetical protein ACFBSD_16560 [Paracoccaceae bacterium]
MTDKQTDLAAAVAKTANPTRRKMLRTIAAAAAVYSAPSIASFSMEGLRYDQAHAFGQVSNTTFGDRGGNGGEGFFFAILRLIRRFIVRLFGADRLP